MHWITWDWWYIYFLKFSTCAQSNFLCSVQTKRIFEPEWIYEQKKLQFSIEFVGIRNAKNEAKSSTRGWCFSWFFIEISNVKCSRVKKLGFRSFPIQPKNFFIAITGWCSLVWMLSEMMEKSLVNYIVDFPCKVWHWSGVSNISEK